VLARRGDRELAEADAILGIDPRNALAREVRASLQATTAP
jgi:hypothetical protein